MGWSGLEEGQMGLQETHWRPERVDSARPWGRSCRVLVARPRAQAHSAWSFRSPFLPPHYLPGGEVGVGNQSVCPLLSTPPLSLMGPRLRTAGSYCHRVSLWARRREGTWCHIVLPLAWRFPQAVARGVLGPRDREQPRARAPPSPQTPAFLHLSRLISEMVTDTTHWLSEWLQSPRRPRAPRWSPSGTRQRAFYIET